MTALETLQPDEANECISALVPDHAHVRDAGPLSGISRWQWTTPAGVWLVEATSRLFEKRTLRFTGGGATVALPLTDAGVDALRAVMVALGAIAEETPPP